MDMQTAVTSGSNSQDIEQPPSYLKADEDTEQTAFQSVDLSFEEAQSRSPSCSGAVQDTLQTEFESGDISFEEAQSRPPS